MEKGVRPAVAPAAASDEVETFGNATEKFLPAAPPLMVQVCAVTFPVKVMVPSEAAAICEAEAATIRRAAEIILRVIICSKFVVKEKEATGAGCLLVSERRTILRQRPP
ncbi:hypothetical protein D3C81_1409540 [compost metagenome]